MTEKRYWTGADESIWDSNSLIWENKKELSIIEVVKLLDEQHETITTYKHIIDKQEMALSEANNEFEQGIEVYKDIADAKYKHFYLKVKDTLQKHYKILVAQNKVLNNDNGSIGLLEYIADELGIDLQ